MAGAAARRHARADRRELQSQPSRHESPHDWIVPDWPAPPRVRSLITTRNGGVSGGAHASFNLGLSAGDDAAAVRANRAHFAQHAAAGTEVAAAGAWRARRTR